ncbi:trigger factor, partial [Klebsiella pneumoniae]|uniref:trigger factor n=1 Tax=Klebsiella pneumoniae TaxID=573 RepID=UPI00300BCF1D
LEYIATFEVFPEFTVSGLEDIKVERLQAEVSDADVDNMLDVLRKQNTRFEVVERATGAQYQQGAFGGTAGEGFAVDLADEVDVQ